MRIAKSGHGQSAYGYVGSVYGKAIALVIRRSGRKGIGRSRHQVQVRIRNGSGGYAVRAYDPARQGSGKGIGLAGAVDKQGIGNNRQGGIDNDHRVGAASGSFKKIPGGGYLE